MKPPASRTGRLRTRVTLLFLLASSPAIIVLSFALLVVDREIDAQIKDQSNGSIDAARRLLSSTEQRVRAQLDAISKDERLLALAREIEHAPDSDRAEGLAPEIAARSGLDILAIVALVGPNRGSLLSSAHLPAAVGDEAKEIRPNDERPATAYAWELVAGNPPRNELALLGTILLGPSDAPQLAVYGGSLVGKDLFEPISQMGDVSLVLEADSIEPRIFSRQGRGLGAHPRPNARIDLPGSAPGSVAARLGVVVHTERLERIRRRFFALVAALVLLGLGWGLTVGPWLARRITAPILELSDAASRVAANDLEVRVPPRGNDELTDLIEVFNQMVAEIDASRDRIARAERLAAWREAARRIAHEIKNPLFPMQMAMETLRKAYRAQHPDLTEIVEESTRAVLDEVRSLSQLVSEFSEFARLPKPQPSAVPVIELFDQAARLYRDHEGVRLEIDREALERSELPDLWADREQIGRALTNLVKNAVEAIGPRQGHVRLDARLESRGRPGVRLIVEDDGPGMSEEVRAQLFSPYFTTKEEGTGLGLAIVERIVAEHDGEIDVDSREGEGTVFSVWLPGVDSVSNAGG